METTTMHQRLLAAIRRPKFILGCLLIVGLLCNIATFYYMTLPPLFEHREKKNELASKQKELEQMVAMPPVVQVSDTQIEDMLRKVPVRIDEVQLLTRFHRYAEESKVVLHNVEIGKQAASRPGPAEGAADNRQTDDNSSLQLGQYELKLIGTLPELMSFMDRLKQTEQILDIARWNTVHITDSLTDDTNGNLIASEYWIYELYLTIQTHSMPGYAEYFENQQITEGSSIEDALRQFDERYPQAVQLESVWSNK